MTLPTWATEKAREIVSHAWRVPVATALIEAERRGAERMRERAGNVVGSAAAVERISAEEFRREDAIDDSLVHTEKAIGLEYAEKAIRALPLEESGS